jgi:Ca2+/Na+ antiporter
MKRRKLDKVFFLLYNYYYKDGNYKEGKFEKFVPWHYTIFILNLGSILWTILIMSIGIYYLFHMFVNKSYSPYFLCISLIYFSFYYSYFINNRRYQKIYDEFKNNVKNSKSKSILTLIFVLLAPLILIIGSALLWHNML